MLHHPPPDTHGLYLDHTPTGLARIVVTHAGRRILSLTGPHRDAAYSRPLSNPLPAHRPPPANPSRRPAPG